MDLIFRDLSFFFSCAVFLGGVSVVRHLVLQRYCAEYYYYRPRQPTESVVGWKSPDISNCAKYY